MAPAKKDKEFLKYYKYNASDGSMECLFCSNHLKSKKTHNLKTHLRRMHQIDLKTTQRRPNQTQDATTTTNRDSIILARTIPKWKLRIDISKHKLIRSYIGLVTEDDVPFHILDSQNMKNITEPICQGMQSIRLNAEECKKALGLIVTALKVSLKSEMKGKLVSIKIDKAERIPNMYVISVHFENDDEIQNKMIHLIDLRTTNDNKSKQLVSELMNTLRTYDINLQQQIVSITVVEGANQLLRDALGGEFNKIPFGCCAAEIADSCAYDITSNVEINMFLDKCRTFIRYILKTFSNINEIFESNNCQMPQIDCASSNCNSTFSMVSSLNTSKDLLLTKIIINLSATDDNQYFNSKEFWEFIEAYTEFFNPLQQTINDFHKNQYHYGDVYAIWLKCQLYTEHLLQETLANEQPLKRKIGSIVLTCIKDHTTQLLANECFNACLFLDPRFQHTLSSKSRTQAVHYLKILWNKLSSCTSNYNNSATNETTSSSTDVKQEYADNGDQLLEQFLCGNIKTGEYMENTSVYGKIDSLKIALVRSDTNIVEYWKEKASAEPELHALSRICFCIPPEQVNINAALSSLKEIISRNNNTLDHETLLNILLVKTNPSFLDKAVNNLSLFEFHSPQNADEQMNEDSYLIYEDGPSEWPDADDTSFDDTRKRKSSHCSSEDSDDDISLHREIKEEFFLEEEDDDDEISPQDENDLEPRSPETFTDALDNSNDFDTRTRKSKIEDSSDLVTRTKRRKM